VFWWGIMVVVARPGPSTGYAQAVDAKIAYQVSGNGSTDLSFDYWPDGLDGQMRSDGPPFSNMALVADNDRMYHRIGWIGDPALSPPDLSPSAEIDHLPEGGWIITDRGRPAVRYPDKDIRMSIVWKAQVTVAAVGTDAADPLTPEVILETFSSDLAARGVRAPAQVTSLSNPSWLDLVHSTYYVPVSPSTERSDKAKES
jgi:hypothetical protein